MHYSLTLMSLFFYTLFFLKLIELSKIKYALYLFSILVASFLPFEVFLITGFNQINYISETLMFLGMVVFSCILIYYLLKNKVKQSYSIKAESAFLTAFLITGLFSVVSSYFKKQFIESSLDLYYFFKMLSIIGSATAFILFAIGFWTKSKNTTKIDFND